MAQLGLSLVAFDVDVGISRQGKELCPLGHRIDGDEHDHVTARGIALLGHVRRRRLVDAEKQNMERVVAGKGICRI